MPKLQTMAVRPIRYIWKRVYPPVWKGEAKFNLTRGESAFLTRLFYLIVQEVLILAAFIGIGFNSLEKPEIFERRF